MMVNRAGVARCLITAVLVLISGLVPGVARADRPLTNLELEMTQMADSIAKFLQAHNEKTIALGQFTAPAQLAASAGPGIALALKGALEKKEITISRKSRYSVEGRYSIVKDAETQQVAVKIEGQILDSSGEVVEKYHDTRARGVFGAEPVAQMGGATVHIPPSETEKKRGEILQTALKTPHTLIKHAMISAGSDYAVEVQVKSSTDMYEPRVPRDDEGNAFVEIKRGEVYAVKLVNNSPHEAAVTITIDGVNIFAFSENKEYSYMIIKAGQSAVIKGWHRNDKVSDSFQITEYSKSASAEILGNDGQVGMINVTFKAAWPTDGPPPSDEISNQRAEIASRAADATGRGPEVNMEYAPVVRKVGRIRDAITVRYSK